jgi:hypothetical protein
MRCGTVAGGAAVLGCAAVGGRTRMPSPALRAIATACALPCAGTIEPSWATGAAKAHCVAHSESPAGAGPDSWHGAACVAEALAMMQLMAKDACASRSAASTNRAILRKLDRETIGAILRGQAYFISR